eukprot:958706-Pyramimonas_sp.AAC.1
MKFVMPVISLASQSNVRPWHLARVWTSHVRCAPHHWSPLLSMRSRSAIMFDGCWSVVDSRAFISNILVCLLQRDARATAALMMGPDELSMI